MKKSLLFLAALLALTPGAFGQEPLTDRDILDSSLSWGTDVDTGKIAIDPYLLSFYDPENRVLVVNSRAVERAAAEAGAEITDDGSWVMSDGQTLKPLLGEVAIYAGDEPAELREALAGMPQTTLARVQLAAKASALAIRIRWFRRCTACQKCPYGCDGHTIFYLGGNYRTCGSGGFFNVCIEYYQDDFCGGAYKYTCANCTGPAILGLADTYRWGCAHGC